MKYLLWNPTFDGMLMVMFAYAAIEALNFPTDGRYLPLGVAVTGFVLTSASLVLDLRRRRRIKSGQVMKIRGTLEGEAVQDIAWMGVLVYTAITAAFCVAIWLVGARLASAVFLFVLLRYDGKVRTPFAILSAVIVVAGITALEVGIGVRMPPNLLFGR